MALAFSAFGITGVGASELFAYPYWCIEKGYARYAGPRSDDDGWARRARGWIAGHAARRLVQHGRLHGGDGRLLPPRRGGPPPAGARPQGAGDDPDPLADVPPAAEGTPLAGLRGRSRGSGFLLGAWAVLFKTLYVATAANSRLTADFLDLSGIWRQANLAMFAAAYLVRFVLFRHRRQGTDPVNPHSCIARDGALNLLSLLVKPAVMTELGNLRRLPAEIYCPENIPYYGALRFVGTLVKNIRSTI